MKIAFLTNGMFPVPAVRGGAAETLVSALLDMNEKERCFDVLTISAWDERAEKAASRYKSCAFRFLKRPDYSGVHLYRYIPLAFQRVFLRIPAHRQKYRWQDVYRAIDDFNPNYVILENAIQPNLVKRYGRKVILHLHNDFLPEAASPALQKELRMALRNCGGVLAVSEFLAGTVRSFEPSAAGKVKVLMNAIDLGAFKRELSADERELMRRQCAIPFEGACVALFAGRICPEKGVLELVRAFRRLENPDCRLLLLGSSVSGETRLDPYTRTVLKACEGDDRIRFLGYVPHEDIWKWYRLADVCVVPSQRDESFGLVVLEGLAAEKMLICSRRGGIPEITGESGAVLLETGEGFEKRLYQALREAAENPALRAEYGRRAAALTAPGEYYDLPRYYRDFVDCLRVFADGR